MKTTKTSFYTLIIWMLDQSGLASPETQVLDDALDGIIVELATHTKVSWIPNPEKLRLLRSKGCAQKNDALKELYDAATEDFGPSCRSDRQPLELGILHHHIFYRCWFGE